MTLTLMGLLTENTDRIVHAGTNMANAKIQSFLTQGCKAYQAVNGKLIPTTPKSHRFPVNIPSNTDELVVYYLTDEEVEKIKKLEGKITELNEQYRKQIQLTNSFLPAYIQKLLGREADQPSSSNSNLVSDPNLPS